METKIKKKSKKLKFTHKWLGLPLCFFLFMFALSGIFLNHRQVITSIDIPRSILPEEFQFKNWNKGAVKGAIKLSQNQTLLFGANGIWSTDSLHKEFKSYNNGLKGGADNRIIGNIVRTSTGDIFAISTYDLYQLDLKEKSWKNVSNRLICDDRLSDLATRNDSLVVLSRSHIYVANSPYTNFEKREIIAPNNYKNEVSWFRTMWTLHSGELFGLTGKLVVDFVGVLTIILCISGLIITFFPGIIKRSKKRTNSLNKRKKTWLRKSFKWHNKVGALFIGLFILLIFTGMFLRPPLLIGIVRGKSKPIPGTMLDSKNPWYDKLRAIRYDNTDHSWIIYASSGFYETKRLDMQPKKMLKEPPVSVMGINVLQQIHQSKWVVASFSGIYVWDKQTGKSTDLLTGRLHVAKRGMPTVNNAVAGYTDILGDSPVIFHYNEGAKTINPKKHFTEMPTVFKKARMSLWHLSLEIHTGRIYTFFSGIIAALYIFLAGFFSLIVFITGYVVYRKHYKLKKRKTIKS